MAAVGLFALLALPDELDESDEPSIRGFGCRLLFLTPGLEDLDLDRSGTEFEEPLADDEGDAPC